MAKDTVGWYAELPRTLVEQFQRLYPEKGIKRRMTEAFVRRAVILRGEQPATTHPVDPKQLPLFPI